MAVTGLDVPPWELPFTPFSMAKIVVIANADVNWSYSVCAYYCQKRGIPVQNILSIAFGNGGAGIPPVGWASGGRATVLTALIQPLRTKLQVLRETAVIIGSGCPSVVAFENLAGVVNQWIGLSGLCAVALGFKDAQLTSYHVATVSGQAKLLRTITEAGFYFGTVQEQRDSFLGQAYAENLNIAYQAPGTQGNVNLDTSNTYLGSYDFSYPSPSLTALMADGSRLYTENFSTINTLAYVVGRPHVPVARLGWASYGGGYAGQPPVVETEALVRAMIDRTTSAMTAHRVAEARAKPLRFHLTPQDGGVATAEHWARLYVASRSWGVNAEYAHFSTVTALTESLAPAAGSKYAETNIAAGYSALPAYFIAGGWDNTAGLPASIYAPPYSVAFSALPGGSMMQGPSAGFQFSLNNLTRGGSAALTDNTHITSDHIGLSHATYFHNLLRGMSWLEASAYGRLEGNEACGDPLWAPYGLDFSDPGPLNPDATPYSGRQHIDSRTGFKTKPADLRREWTGLRVVDPEHRHPLDLAHDLPVERGRGSRSPEPPDTFLNEPAPPAMPVTGYDFTLADTLDDGGEIVSSGWFSIPTEHYVFNLTGSAFATGANDHTASWSFPNVTQTTCSSALLYLTVSIDLGALTFRVRGELNNAAPSARWSTTNRPSSKYIAPTGNTGTVALSTPQISDLGLRVVDVTTIVQEILASPFWLQGRINFWAYVDQAIIGGGCLFTEFTARLVIIP